MKKVILGFFLLISGCSTQPTQTPSSTTSKSPNIVILFADDMGYGDLGSYGHPVNETPNLDQLASEGIRFTSFYVAAPGCTPSRASLLTGRYPMRCNLPHVIGPEAENGLPPSEITLAKALKTKGYQTAQIGKWHLGTHAEYLPNNHGFDHAFYLPYSNDMIPPWVQTAQPLHYYRNGEALPDSVDQRFLTKNYTQEAVEFIQNNKEKPFFLYLAYSMPHLPVYPAPEFEGTSKGGRYGDVMKTIDWSAGEIVKALKDAGVAENTLVIFTSDNGPWQNMPERMIADGQNKFWHAGSAGHLRGTKHTTHEGGMRVPAIFWWPGKIPAKQISSDLVTSLDIFPTVLNLTNIPLPSDRIIDGVDIWNVLANHEKAPERTFYYYLGTQLQAARDAKGWKYRATPEWAAPTEEEWYQLNEDPSEMWNRLDEFADKKDSVRLKMKDFDAQIQAEYVAMNKSALE